MALRNCNALKQRCTMLEHFDRRVSILRLFGVFGSAEPRHRLIPSIVNSANKNEPLLLSDGLQIKRLVHLAHVCRCIAYILTTDAFNGQIVNIGSGEGISIKQLILSLINEGLLERDLPKFDAIPRRKTQTCLSLTFQAAKRYKRKAITCIRLFKVQIINAKFLN